MEPQVELPEMSEAERFPRAMRFVAAWEGAYVDHPADPGGATNIGVTQRTYDKWRDLRHLPRRPVRELTKEERDSVYSEWYWLGAGCDRLPWPLALVHFDTAVNCGQGRAAKFLVESKGDVAAYLKLRRAFYLAIVKIRPSQVAFLKVWLRRLDDLKKECNL